MFRPSLQLLGMTFSIQKEFETCFLSLSLALHFSFFHLFRLDFHFISIVLFFFMQYNLMEYTNIEHQMEISRKFS